MTRPGPFGVSFPLLGFNPSGGVRMLIRVANELARRGHRVAFSVPPRASTPPIELAPGIEVCVRPDATGLRARTVFATALPRALVHVASGYQTPLLIQLGLRLQRSRARIVYLVQNDEVTSHVRHGRAPAALKPLLEAVARVGFRVPARRIAVSRFVAARVGENAIQRVIPPGIEEHFLRPVPARDPARERVRVGVLAHPGRVKGMDVALAALEPLRDDARVEVVVFDGAHATDIPAWATQFSSLRHDAAGPTPDIDDFYSTIDIFVFPSWVEGFGLPPLEAMARGAAVVLTDSGGVREYAEADRNCLLVAPGDAGSMRAAVARLVADPPLRDALARAGRETAQRFPVQEFARACADEIERVLDAARAGDSD
ncbi:MAG TPA: glycosyltransferase family 4 protein [Candidatus Krumholzibacteria bacterium]